MNNMKIIIVDDNPADIFILKEAIENSCSNVEIVGEFSTGFECLDFLGNNIVDLVFLDIDMPALSGVEVAKMLLDYECPPRIAFVTGRKEFAVQAFELSAIDYVLKPYDKDRIKKTIDKVFKRIGTDNSVDTMKELLDKLSSGNTDKDKTKIAIKDYKQRAIRFIKFDDIAYVERDGRQVVVNTKEEAFPTYFTIDKLYSRLKDSNFYKASQSSIVNSDYVEHMIPNGDGTYDITLKCFKGKIINVSRSNSKEILQKLGL